MNYKLYAMDTSFYNSIGSYSFDARCEMLNELGFNATYLTLWDEAAWQDVNRLAQVKTTYGLDVAAVYTTLDIAGADDHAGNMRILRLVETIKGCSTVELAVVCSDKTIGPSDSAGDAQAARWLERLIAAAERNNVTLALYPHFYYWLERIEDAVRLCRLIDHPSLRAVFCGFHWYAVDGERLQDRLAEAAPFLCLANVAGSRRVEGRWNGITPTIEPLDDGELDNFALLGALRRVGYSGMVGIQGFSVGGDAYTKLKRSITVFRDIERRLDAHPEWAQLRWK
jgi:sugar phosphate isomerase/epimerase